MFEIICNYLGSCLVRYVMEIKTYYEMFNNNLLACWLKENTKILIFVFVSLKVVLDYVYKANIYIDKN